MTLIVNKNGVLQFTADTVAVNGSTYNFATTAPPPPPAGRLLTAQIRYLHGSVANNMDVTLWKNLAGRIDATVPVQDYPHFNSYFDFTLPAGKYLAAQLTANGPQSTHTIKCPIYGVGNPLRVSMSLQPGDFNPATALVVKENVIYDDNFIFLYRNGAGTNFYIGIQNGVPVYINVQAMDPSRQTNVRFATQ